MRVSLAAVSPDGRYLACLNGRLSSLQRLSHPVEGTLGLWDTVSGRCLAEVEGDLDIGNPVPYCVAFSPDGKTVLFHWGRFGREFATGAWDTATGACLWQRTDPEMGYLVALPDSGRFAAITASRPACYGDEDWDVRVWDVRTGRLVRMVRRGAHRLAVSPDGSVLAVVGPGPGTKWQAVTLYNTATWQPICRLGRFGPDARIYQLDLSGRAEILAIVGVDDWRSPTRTFLSVYRIGTGRLLCEVRADRSRGIRLFRPPVFCSDGRSLLYGTCRIDLAHPTRPPVVDDRFPRYRFGTWHGDPDLVLCQAGQDLKPEPLQVWNVRTGALVRAWSAFDWYGVFGDGNGVAAVQETERVVRTLRLQ